MDNHSFAPHNSSIGNIKANIMAVLMYAGVFLFALIPYAGFLAWALPLIVLFVEKNSDFVKFHAAQSLIIQIIFLAISIITGFLGLLLQVPTNIINSLINGAADNPIIFITVIIELARLAIYVFLAYKAFNYTTYRITLVSDYADTILNKIS
ncbi:MAG: DUF4870 domain-containing protein [Lachnospira sp.]|nr:DUF4870 domain-containing protein [Lachnospira sp.]